MKALLLCAGGDIRTVAALAAARGYGFEIQSFFDPNAPITPQAIEEHRDALRGISLRALHGYFGDLHPGSFDPLVRGLARQRFDESCRIAVALDVTHVILHHGYVPRTSTPANWVARSTAFWKDFVAATPPSLCFHIENMLDQDPSMLADLVDGVASPRLDLNLDIGHAHCDSKLPVPKWVEMLGPRIGYVHWHDNNGAADEHLAFGRGTVPLAEVGRALNQYAPDAFWAVETGGPGLQISLDWLARAGFLPQRA